jgi:hypothetical protein
MLDHMIDVQLAARASDPAQPMPAAQDVATIRAELETEFVPECLATVSRPVYECWQQATSRAAFERCANLGAASRRSPGEPD